jgi:succinyl-diaminopimelate desuccinylase
MKQQGFTLIDSMEDQLVQALSQIVAIPAISPVSGGEGERKKLDYLKELIKDFGFDEIKEYVINDDSGTERPSLVAIKRGKNPELPAIWVVAHTDVVPAGDLSKWSTDPFKAEIKDGKMFGRGTEDNGQELIASLFAVKAMSELGITPERDIGIGLAADEENGSTYGMKFLLKQEGLFGKDDLVIVPDHGNDQGTLLEVAEKSIMWLKVQTLGKSCHGSEPEKGHNAFLAASNFCVEVYQAAKEKYPAQNPLFKPPYSTFEPTKKEANVPNINTIPGEDVFYFDCRIMPEYDIGEVLGFFLEKANEVGKRFGVEIKVSVVQQDQAAPPTSAEAPVVLALKRSLRNVYGVDASPAGIGGGTCGAIFRRAGIPAVVWAKIVDNAHEPNEHCLIENLVGDCKVYFDLFTEG